MGSSFFWWVGTLCLALFWAHGWGVAFFGELALYNYFASGVAGWEIAFFGELALQIYFFGLAGLCMKAD